MNKTLSLKNRIILQFLVVILPISLILAYQTVSDLRRSTEMSNSFHLMDLSAMTKAHYKIFLNGVSDAVDTGKLSGTSIKALEEARGGLSTIKEMDSDEQINNTLQQLETMLGVLQKDNSMAALAPLRDTIREADAKTSKLSDTFTERNSLTIKKAERSANIQQFIALGSFVFIALITVMFVRNVSKLTSPLKVAVNVAEAIAAGDLGHAVETSKADDETGKLLRSLEAMQNSLRNIITQIRSQASILSDTAADLSKSTNQVASSSEHQSKVVMSIAATIEANSVLIEEVAKNALKAQAISAESEQLSVQGGEVIFRVVSDMQIISESVGQASKIIVDLEDKSNRISSIINVIRDISDQTNLLALNAAIEAARAGEQGRGFAVVADEVRKLADRTGQSTKEITEMIGKIQVGTGHAVSSMEATVKRVADGESLTQQAGNSIGKIKSGAQQVSQSVSEISVAMQKESLASSEITRNIEEIAKMSQQNNLAIHATTETAMHLKKLSDVLQSAVGHFKL